MKYDSETTKALIESYKNLGADPASIPLLAEQFSVPERSIIAKLSSLGLYKRKEYVNKLGEPPIKKEVYVENIARLLGENLELLESLEKVNKNVLKMLEAALSQKVEEWGKNN
jgi:Zn-dependent peptidase ImmA (M78 family)